MGALRVSQRCLALKRVYRKNMALGFGISAASHFLVGGSILLYLLLSGATPDNIPTITVKTRGDIPRPPTLSDPPVTAPVRTPTGVVPPTVGIPEPVPDSEAPEDVVIPTQDQLSSMVPDAPVLDLAQVGVNIDVESVMDDLLPPHGTFTPVEEMPFQIRVVTAKYPPLAQRAGIEGTVWIDALVDKEGKVRDVKIVKQAEANAGFEEAAVEAAYQCVWKPAISNGQPVAVWVTYKVTFKLKN